MLLFLILAYTLSSTAAPPAPHRRANDACNDINNCRTLFQIIWGCLATIFAFTWVSVHPNVPPPHQSALALLWRKLKMMLIAIIAPEVVVGLAARQFVAALQLSKDFDGLSMTHGFFFAMGGFVSPCGCVVVTRDELDDEDFLKAIQSIDAEDIMDKSKGDAFSRGVALLQGLWFTTQYLARVHQKLAVTELEVATMAFAVMNVFTWILWWYKPLGVQRQIVVGPHRANLPRQTRFEITVLGNHSANVDDNPLGLTSVPDFWSLPITTSTTGPSSLEMLGLVGIPLTSATLFGALHCTAWNFGFPTEAEMWLWRVSSLIVASSPLIVLGIMALTRCIPRGDFLLFLLFIYILARLFLITLPFALLRSLPSSVFLDVDWNVYIPHL